MSLAPAVSLAERRDAVVAAWYATYADKLRGRGRIDEDEFTTLFGRELEWLDDDDRLDLAMRSTAQCLMRRGVALADALTAGSLLHAVARDVDEAALDALDLRRMRIYTHVYLAGAPTEAKPCPPPRVTTPPARHAALAMDEWGLVGESDAMQRVRELIARGAKARSILVTGETGTGKELAARAIHAASGSAGPFLAVNCAALPRDLVESELFGHVRGAFTGAGGESPGLFRSADHGTLFLDEITEMAMDTQAKLLRVLEERAVRPVGGTREYGVDVRVVASTNRDPREAIAKGFLREDLFYRLQTITVRMPSLRERREDVPLLVEHFLATFCSRRCGCVHGFAADALDALCAADWPGNVRELRNVVEHAVTTGTDGVIQREDLPPAFQTGTLRPVRDLPDPSVPTLAEAEAELIRLALAQHRGNKLRAARALGISRHKLYDKLREMGIDPPGGYRKV